jgi:hypothetical protein
VLVLTLLSTLFADAASSTGVSPVFTVDLQVRSVAVSGRVLDAASRAPISAATVTLAGQSTSSSGAGQFSFASVSLSSGSTLAVSKSGYATYTGTVPAPAGATAITVPDILLQASPVGSKPSVTAVRQQFEGISLSGATVFNDFTATVDWNSHPAGSVEFTVNGSLPSTVPTTTTEATASINMGLGFNGSFTPGANKVTAVAVSSDGARSDPFDQPVTVIPAPSFLSFLGSAQWPLTKIKLHATFPPYLGALGVENIPFLNNLGVNFSIPLDGDYDFLTGEYAISYKKGLGGIGPEYTPGMSVGQGRLDFDILFSLTGIASATRGLNWPDHAKVTFSGHDEIKVMQFLFTEAAGPWARILDLAVPFGLDVNSIQRINVYALFDIDVIAEFTFPPPPALPVQFKDLLVEPGIGLKAAYEPDLVVGEFSLYVGGMLTPSIELYPQAALKEISADLFLGVELIVFGSTWFDEEWALVTWRWPSGGAAALRGTDLTFASGAQGYAQRQRWVRIKKPNIHHPRNRDFGVEGSVVESLGRRNAKGYAGGSGLAAFRNIGRQVTDATSTAIDIAGADGQILRKGGPTYYSQVDLPISTNVFNGSRPSMASRSNELMLVYVTDNGATNLLQYTDIRWTRFDGTNWSVPATIQTNTQAEFSPQVAYDGNGDALAIWERVADPNFNQTNLPAMAAQMEIVWAKWSHTSGAWSSPVPLTSNGYLDHAPLLCGPMVGGTVLATWTANTSNLLMGTNGAGSQVLWAQWNPGSQRWSPPQTLLTNLPYRLSQSLSGVSNLAVYAWSRDMDGVLTNDNDQEVFYVQWQGGAWGAATQFTTNTAGNRNARVSVGTDGHSYLVWQSGTNLVLSRDFSTNSTMVRADSQTAGFADYAMTIGPAGNLALLWQEMSQAGSDAHYRVLDPASATWSKDAQLFNDPPLERSFAPVWDAVGNLTVAYNKVEIIYTNKTVTLEGGGSVTITNVPQPGRVDLCVTKRRLIKDVSLAAGGFTVDAENYLPGAAVTLSATLRNSGDLAVSNAVVAFYDGHPTNSGVLITNVVISGWLEGAATNTVSALWVVPEPATNHVLYAVADPAGALTEFDESNNTQSLRIGGTDLAVSLVRQSAETNGAVRVIAQVQNLGAPSATNSVLAIRRSGSTNAPLLTVAVPLLEPGRLAQVALDLPAGTQPAGEQVYTLRADETRVTSDVDTNNNTASFAVNLWIDSDADGMPDSWELANGLNPNDPGDALLDKDGDRMSNLAEYRAGTSPTDPLSYLRITSLAVGGTNGVQVVWGATANRLYTVERAAVLGAGFTIVAEHLLSTPPQNVYLDLSAPNASSFFYRIKVE